MGKWFQSLLTISQFDVGYLMHIITSIIVHFLYKHSNLLAFVELLDSLACCHLQHSAFLSFAMPSYLGISLADGAGAAITSSWDFPPKVLVIFAKGSSDFLQVPWERQIPRAEACSGENVGGVNNLL